MDLIAKKIHEEFILFSTATDFPCVAAKDAAQKGRISIMVADHLACPKDDAAILNFIYTFTDNYRNSKEGFHSAAVIFKSPGNIPEEIFDGIMWQRLAALRTIDEKKYAYDSRVDPDPSSPEFSFSLMEEAFFIIGIHPQSSRPARRFQYPTLIFNPHAQFTEMKKNSRYEKMKTIVRKRDLAFSGSVNPMLTDFGTASEAYQYSGRRYVSDAKCPFTLNAHQ